MIDLFFDERNMVSRKKNIKDEKCEIVYHAKTKSEHLVRTF